MSNSGSRMMDELEKKTSTLKLNPKASEFKPGMRANAPAFVPRSQQSSRPPQSQQPGVLNVAGNARQFVPFQRSTPQANLNEPPKAVSLNINNANPPTKTVFSLNAASETKPEDKSASQSLETQSNEVVRKGSTPAVETIPELSKEDEEALLNQHFKEHYNIIFIGHVDAGKSTLGGNILFITGMVDKRTMEKYEREAKEVGRESWYLSWALDTNSEERAKGKTVEVGKAYFETDLRRYTILDAPGHKNFVPSMLEGAAQADVGVLVISARKGEFETGFDRGGQTREHTMLAKTNGVKHLIVAINKMDDPTVMWEKKRYDEIINKITPFLRASGYNTETDITFLPISGYSGANIKELDNKNCPWYKGKPLLEILDSMHVVDRKLNAPLRMPIMEKYRDMGTIVGGKIESGFIKIGQKLVIMPNKRACEVATIFGEDEVEQESGICGDNIRIRLRGVEEEEITEGHVLCDAKWFCPGTTTFDAQIVIVDAKNIITGGYGAVLHIHAVTEEVVLSELLHAMDKKGRKSRVPPKFVKKGMSCIARFTTLQPICVERFKDFPQLGRFTLRDEGKTIAIGKIVKIH
ncbi:hypothetical protein BB559_003690 [Furculomyces boomerangus]|uniref:Eukaryotic peptide chain release factor GTP-binding subunit n=2 Tax=Harpellales TaxID=61421 RepID=A0A2T9YJQ3_9FUNG|nr:hypothetical protein BB559_003690 [Furculomyces boomerangus]PVZ97656.1 hypothetical protein BB558_006377 [Smittium angustum]